MPVRCRSRSRSRPDRPPGSVISRSGSAKGSMRLAPGRSRSRPRLVPIQTVPSGATASARTVRLRAPRRSHRFELPTKKAWPAPLRASRSRAGHPGPPPDRECCVAPVSGGSSNRRRAEPDSVEPGEPVLRANPEIAVGGLRERIHRVLRKTVAAAPVREREVAWPRLAFYSAPRGERRNQNGRRRQQTGLQRACFSHFSGESCNAGTGTAVVLSGDNGAAWARLHARKRPFF